METIRDSAFGKLVRLSTNSRFLQYPEEIDHATCQQCRKAPPQPKDEEAPPSPVGSAEEDETWGLYSVMSQASRVTRRNSWQPTLDGSECGIRPGTGLGEGAIVVDWRPNDSEVWLFQLSLPRAKLIKYLESSKLEYHEEVPC